MASYKGYDNVEIKFESFRTDGLIKQYIERLNSDDIIDFQFIGNDDYGLKNFMIVTAKKDSFKDQGEFIAERINSIKKEIEQEKLKSKHLNDNNK